MFIKRVSNIILCIPSWGYAVFYIFTILTFATIYCFLSNNFYHPTVQYEYSHSGDTKAILAAIQKNIFRNQKVMDNNKKIKVNDKVFIDGKEIEVHSLKFEENENNEVSFKVNLVINNKSDISGLSQLYETQKFKFSLNNKSGRLDKKSNEMIYYFILTPVDTKTIEPFKEAFDYKRQDIYKTLFPEKYINGSSPYDVLVMTIPQRLLNKIIALHNANMGFPSYTKNTYIRMFYLSAVTITTVGYGDIIPITTLARILISIEAILGILISGLFLNSLALKISKSSSFEKT